MCDGEIKGKDRKKKEWAWGTRQEGNPVEKDEMLNTAILGEVALNRFGGGEGGRNRQLAQREVRQVCWGEGGSEKRGVPLLAADRAGDEKSHNYPQRPGSSSICESGGTCRRRKGGYMFSTLSRLGTWPKKGSAAQRRWGDR